MSDKRPASQRGWVHEAFLWTTASLAVIATSATAPGPGPGAWPSSRAAPPLKIVAPVRPSLPAAARVPAPQRRTPEAFIAFQDPVPGYPVISPFGLRQLPWEEAGRLHRGVDIAAPGGTPVLAASDGVVAAKGVDAGYGRFIELRHAGGLTTLYGHLNTFEAAPSQAVKAGQPVGLMGSTGSSTGSHLHFEIHDADGRPLNPELFLGRSFMSQAALPMRQGLRLPRGLRPAYVSFIPAAKRGAMADRQAEAAAREVEAHPVKARDPLPAALPAPSAPQAEAAGDDPIGALLVRTPAPKSSGRVHVRIFPYG